MTLQYAALYLPKMHPVGRIIKPEHFKSEITTSEIFCVQVGVTSSLSIPGGHGKEVE
jgi:hypothetical protein